jgi:eukaryotic-like serine/threonine-protein kinase
MTTSPVPSIDEAARELFERILDADPTDRAQLLGSAPADVAHEAEALLQAWNRSSGFLEPNVVRQRFGPWHVMGSIGRGGMGDVSLVRRVEGFVQIGALKRVRRELVTPEVLERFRLERAALARLDHANVARLIDGGETEDGEPYLVMEFVDGEPIDRWCDTQQLDVAARIRLALPILDALRAAHARLVIHRDLKPSNVLVAHDGVPKLLDFGIARLLDPEQAAAPTLPAMTPRYASPEQLLAESATTATDVYGFGVLLYELLTGVHPHGDSSASPAEMQEAILRRTPNPASEAVVASPAAMATAERRSSTSARVQRVLRGDLDIVLAKALRKEPERRYPTADAFAEDLRRWLAGRAVLACGDSFRYRATKFVRRNKLATTAAAVLAIGAPVTAIVSLLALRSDALARREAESQMNTSRAVIEFLANDVIGTADPAAGGANRTMREVLDEAARSLPARLADQPRALSTLDAIIGQAYRRLGRHDEARSHLERAVAGQPDVVSRLNAQRELAVLTADLGDAANADTSLRRVAEESERELGETHGTTTTTLSALGEVLMSQGRYDEALATLRDALSRVKRAAPPSTDEALAIEGNIARTLHAAGRFTEAEAASRAHLRAVEERFGNDHAETVAASSNLGLLLADAGNHQEAKALIERALAGAKTIYGPEAPATLIIQSNLALLAFNVRDFEGARAMASDVYEIRRRVLGEEHPDTLISLNGMAMAALNIGDSGAIELLERLLEVRTRTLGPRHPQTLNSGHNLGAALAMNGRFDDAATILTRVLEERTSTLGEDHPSTIITILHLARAHARRGLVADATGLLDLGAERAARVLGAESDLANAFAKQLDELRAESTPSK